MKTARLLLSGLALATAVITGCTSPSASERLGTSRSAGVSGAGFTTVNETVDGTDHCKNGNPNNNCNIYDGKAYVWLNGGPSTAYVGDGTYFFAVLSPGGQADPNDGAANNLSDDFDAYTNRIFTVTDATVSYGGSHDFANNKIRLMPYADTTNPGGVYIMAICSLGGGYPVQPSKCKYDAFKVESSEPKAADLTVTKTATASYKRTYAWLIDKSVDKTEVKQIGGSATFDYTVEVSHDAGTDSAWQVDGSISVTNLNDFEVAGVNVTDAITGAVCNVTDGTNVTVPAGGTVNLSYSCLYGSAPGGSQATNTATATWPDTYKTPTTSASFAFVFDIPSTPTTLVDNCVNVTDTYAGTLGTACVGGANPATYTYARIIPIPKNDCQSYDNTATFVANTTGATASDSVSVEVCGPIWTGALTIGFWQNKNGQAILTGGAATANVCNSGTWLRGYAPFQDLSATATCKDVATYVFNVVKAANASGSSMNAMLKAQMLATALDVYFSTPTLGGNKINAPFPLGGVAIDLTMVCATINLGLCSGGFEDVTSVFGTGITVAQLLDYAASQSNVGGSTWYGNVKATQELAKDTFDAINNQMVFAP